MEDGDTEKYHPSRVIQDFVFLSRKRGCISLQVYNNFMYYTPPICFQLTSTIPILACIYKQCENCGFRSAGLQLIWIYTVL